MFVDKCLELQIAGKLDAATASMAKYWITDLQCQVIDECVQLHGGYGYMWEYPIARPSRRARAAHLRRHQRDHEGTDRAVHGPPGTAMKSLQVVALWQATCGPLQLFVGVRFREVSARRGRRCPAGAHAGAVGAARRLHCDAYMDASRVASGVLQVLTWRINCGLISGLWLQPGAPAGWTAGLDGQSRGWGSSRPAGFSTELTQGAKQQPCQPTVLTALPSLARLLAHALVGLLAP